MKKKERTPEQIWSEYLKKYGKEWDSLAELLPPEAQEDLIMGYYFRSFEILN